jgi:transcriptional regulator with XRE-family HTH domain
MERVSCEFIRALRGKLSQRQLARRLGYRGNPITDWERGERFPTVQETLRAALLMRIDVAKAFRRFAPSLPIEVKNGTFLISEWLKLASGSIRIGQVATRCGHSRYAVSRWLKGQAQPRLPEFFKLLDAITGRLPEWVAEFVSIERVPSLLTRFQAGQVAKSLAFEAPWTEAILRLLETIFYKSHKHDSQWMATCLGITESELNACLQKLLTAQIVSKERGKYVVRETRTVDTQGGEQALRNLKRHWCKVADERLLLPRPDDLFAYNVMSISRADLEVIRTRLKTVFSEIRSIVAASQPEELVALMNLQLVVFDPEPPN